MVKLDNLEFADKVKGTFRQLFPKFPSSFWFLLTGYFANGLGVFVGPFLTLLLTQERGFGPALASLMAALVGLGGATYCLFLGGLSDRFGRKPVMVTGMLVAAAFTVVLGFVRPLPFIALSCILLGVSDAAYRVAMRAYLTDNIKSDRRRAGQLI